MTGYDGEFTALVYRDGTLVAADVHLAWDWDDDDENQVRISAYIPKPEDL